jgi:hypothetical protein
VCAMGWDSLVLRVVFVGWEGGAIGMPGSGSDMAVLLLLSVLVRGCLIGVGLVLAALRLRALMLCEGSVAI